MPHNRVTTGRLRDQITALHERIAALQAAARDQERSHVLLIGAIAMSQGGYVDVDDKFLIEADGCTVTPVWHKNYTRYEAIPKKTGVER